jgi:hypothetical protein
MDIMKSSELTERECEGYRVAVTYLQQALSGPEWVGKQIPLVVHSDPENGLAAPNAGAHIIVVDKVTERYAIGINRAGLLLGLDYPAWFIWVIGHELGHIKLGEKRTDPEIELWCDRYAWNLSKDLGYPNGACALGLKVYREFMRRIMPYESTFAAIDEHGSESHPPLKVRVEQFASLDGEV